MKCLIIGSNFGLEGHSKAIKKASLIPDSIASPNIYKKKIGLVINKYQSYYEAIEKFDKGILVLSTLPKIQTEIINYIFKKNYKKKFLGIMLEKPISNSFLETKKILKRLEKEKIFFNVNFIFANLEILKSFKKISKKIKINQIIYEWKFKQAYFINKKKTWKTKTNEGGGLINFYFIHLAYNLITLFDNLRIDSVEFDKNSKHLEKIKINGSINDIPLKINFDINCNERIHCLSLKNKHNEYKLLNTSEKWTENFKIFKNNLLLEKSFESRIDLTTKEYKKLIKKILKKSDNKEIKKYQLAHHICNKLNNLVHNHYQK